MKHFYDGSLGNTFMTGSLGMEWNSKSHLQWDWENLALFSSKPSESPKQIHGSERVLDNESLYSSGGGGCSGSDLGNGCSSRSSISDSASKLGTGKSEINFEAVIEGFSKDPYNKKEVLGVEGTRALPEVVASVGSGEPMIGLKLGKRTYFEDVCAGENVKDTSFPTTFTSPSTSVKKSRVSHQRMQNICCQVEGCNLDLTAAKEYHRKHRVCANHSKCPKVIVAGYERRFCQQCSRFHDLSEFDQKKRSCRRRLSDHNARRRKPQPETISFNSAMLSSSVYDNRQHMNFLLNKPPFGHLRPPANYTWDGSSDFKFTQTKGSWIRSTKKGDIGGHLQLPSNEISNAASTLRHDIDRLLPFKSTTAEVINQGLEVSFRAPNLNGTPDLRRALSLLSTNSWVPANPGSTSLNQLVHGNNAGGAQLATAAMHSSTDYWTAEIGQEIPTLTCNMHGNNSELQQFELFKTPYDGSLLDSNQIHL